MDAAVKRGITSINGLQKELDIPREQARSLINALETNNVLSKPDERKRRRLLIDPATGALLDEAAVKADRKQKSKQDRAELEAWARNLAGDLRVMDGLEQPRPDPAAGPVSAAAASAVDTGAADIVQMQQAAQQIEEQQPTAADQQRAQREQLQQAKMERQAQALDAQTYGEDDLRALIEADLDAGKKIDAPRMMRLAKQANVKPRAVDTIRRTILAERASGSQPALTDQPIDAEFTDVTGQDAPALPAPTVDPKVAGKLFPFPTEAAARASADKLTQRKGVPYTVAPHPREAGKWVAAPQSKATLALPAPAPAPAAQQPAPVEGEPIDAKWTAFAPESGTLGVPRAQMPQIRAEHRGALVNYLNARGIGHDSEQVPADTLKPTQAEFAPAKVQKAASGGTDRSILVSQDGHVLDGHHQWMAARNAGLPVNIIRLQAPIQDLLQAAKEFPSSTVAAGAATGAATAPDTTTKEQSNAADGQEGQQGQGRREGRREALLSPGATAEQSSAVASPERDKALKRIERGTAFFGTRAKADEFIANAGLGDSHEAVQVKAGRFDVRAKQAAAVDVSTQPQNANTTAEGKPADAASAKVRQLADAEQRPGVKRSLNALADAMAAKDEKTVSAWVAENPDNTTLRKAFEDATGVKLPRTIKGGREAVSAWVAGKVDAAPQQAQDDQQSSEPRDDQRQEPTEPSVRSGNQEGVSGAQGRRERDAQSGDAPPDTGNVAAAQPEDVAQPAANQSGSAAGVRASTADVAGEQEAQGSGNAGTGRKRAGGKESPDAGAGGARGNSRPSVTAPETVSPANPGPGNFHIANPLEVVGGGQVARFNKNKAAIELFIALRDEGRRPTREEQKVLAGYTGWGSFGQELFQGNWSYPQPKQGWEQRDQWLREHLGREDWEGLQRSITNAHYTDPPTVMAMWDMVRRLGFKGGRVLEPGMGIGNFFGMMPLDLKERSKLAGIELDPVTGGMAQMLYPDAAIKVMGYQDSKTPDDFYDLVIGNWPFENTPVADRRYNRLNPMLHDYFFLKTLDQVRPGGIVIGITSAGSMDKKGAVVRRELAKKAELVAAFRLPSGAFEEYAGTKVVTDIIVLRKRTEPLSNVDGEVWVDTVEMDTPAGEKVRVNAYYQKNPQNVVGTIDYGHGTTTFRPGMIVHRPDDMQAQLNRIVAMVPEGAYLPTTRADSISYIANHTSDREGALTRTDAGLFIVRGEHLAPAQEVLKYQVKSQKDTAAREAQLNALIDMRKAYGQLIEAERGTSGAAPDPIRTRLREQYEAFVKAHGPLSDSYGLGYLERIDDPFYYALAALEVKEGAAYRPAAILSQSTIRSKKRITNPSIRDAFVLARNGNVNPSLEDIAAIAKQPADKVRAELVDSGAVFETPGGDIVPSDIYLSGNVREKLRQARAALADGNAGMQRNIAALEKVQPADIPYFNIEVQMGATWVPTRAYEQFVAHMLNRNSTDGIEASYTMGRWKVTIDPSLQRTTEAETGFGTRYYRFGKLVNAAISNQTVVIKQRDPESGSEYVDKTATDEANAKIADMREKFGDWLWSDAERRIEVEREYNEVRNAYASPSFDGSFLNFEGMALSVGRGPFDLRKHQINAIWRALVMRRSLNAHEVGTGKTFTMGGIAIESRRYGIAKKPVLLAHNANSKSVASEIQMMYPAAKVLYIDNLSPKTIDVRMRQIANDDWDLIVLPHSLIERLSFREETLMAMAREEIEALEEEARSAAADDGVRLTDAMLDDPEELKKLRSPTAKELVKARARIIETIRKQAQQSSREGAVPFEDLGIDMVLVDEAHEFKKPPIATRMKMKGLQTQSSLGSIQLNFLTRYVREQNNGGNVHLFTGTPITNTLTEIYHQMRYIMADEMAAVGVDQWDGWFGSFAKEVQDVELTAAGDYEAVNRLRGFINVPELRKLVGQYMDVVFSDDMPEMQPRKTASGKLLSDPSLTELERAELLNGRTEGANDRPYKKVVNETADPTPEQMRIFEHVQSLANEWRDMGGKARKNAMAAGLPVVPIVYEQLAARASFDARLENDEALAGKEGTVPDHPDSKVSRAIRNLLEIYRSDSRATQVVFTNTGLGTTASRAVRDASGGTVKDADGVTLRRQVKVFSPIKDMVERLVQQGIPRSEIEIVDGSTSKDRRKEIADAMNAGTVRIVIGSTQSLGVGVNMQRNLRAMHHLDAPWMPGDLEQRNGRGHRQGNQWNTVMEYRYITDRIDGRRWQVLAIKQKFITDFLKADGETRVIEGDAASDEESDIISTFAEAAGDPRVLIRQKLVAKVEQLKKRERLHAQGVADARQTARYAQESLARLRGTIARIEGSGAEDLAKKAVSDHAGNNFKITVDGKEFADRKDANEALGRFISANMRAGADPMHVGSYGGIAFQVAWPQFNTTPVFVANVAGEKITTGSASVASLEASLRAYPATVDKLREQIQPALDTIQRLEEVAGQPFQRADQLKRAELQLRNLERDISVNPVPPPAWLRNGAAIDTEVRWNGTAFTVTGHRWTAAGWFVIAQDAKGGEVVIPYMDAKDAQGMPLYEEREFKAPIVHAKKDDQPKDGAAPEPAIGTAPLANFAKSGEVPSDQRLVLAAWHKLARTGGLFQFKASQAKDFTGILKDVAPGITIVADDGDSATFEVQPQKTPTGDVARDPSVTLVRVEYSRTSGGVIAAPTEIGRGRLVGYTEDGKEAYAEDVQSRADIERELGKEVAARLLDQPGQAGRSAGLNTHVRTVDGVEVHPLGKPKAVTMTVLDGELSMDASQLKPGVHRGSALYAVALAYAHNNGLVFVPDPAGVSDDAMIRRTEHMLSSALKTGTTRHMLPHPAQGLDWRVGDDQHNVLELIRASADNVMDAVPDLQAVDYDWNTGQFVAADGRPVTRDDFRALADSPSARAARAGVSTLRRGVVSRSLERRAGTPAWRGVVTRLLQLGRAGLRGSQLEGLMYGRGATGARGMTVEALNGIFAPALKQLAADRRLDVQVVATHADLPQSIRDQDDFDDTVQAAFQGRTAYFVASAIRDQAQARRLFAHEVVGHYGMEGLLGPALFAELKRQILSLRDRGKWADVFSEVSRRYERNADGTFRPLDDDTFAAETIAVFAERNILTSILQRAMAAVRAFLRRFFPDMEISKAELRQLLWEAGQRLEGRPYRPTAERALGAGRASSMRQAVERYSFGRNDGGTNAPMSQQDTESTVFYHGGNSGVLSKVEDRSSTSFAQWPGLFASEKIDAAKSHGSDITAFRIPNAQVLRDFEDLDQDQVESTLLSLLGSRLREKVQEDRSAFRVLWKAVVDDRSDKVLDQWAELTGDDPGEASWYAQSLRGQLGTALGFKAIAMDDEHGTSWYIAPGVEAMPDEGRSSNANDSRQAPPSEGLGASGVRAAFAKAPSTLSRLQELIKPDDRSLLDRIKDRLQDWRPAALGALQLRHLGELAEDTLPPVAQYADVVQRMATMRNELQERGHGIVEAGMKYQGAHGEEAKRLFRMLHDATLAGVDPAEAHQPLRMLGADYRTNVEVTEKSVREFVRTMKGQAKLNAGSASVYISRAKEARQLLQQERKRAQSHRQMAPAFAQLSPEAKALWVQMRDAYRAQSAEYEQALISRIEALDFDKAKKATQIARMRLQFEAARVPFYVPLARWGEYWVSGTAPDGTREFYMQERASDQRRVRAELESRGYTAIGAGVKIDTARAQDGATAGFMAEMDQMLQDANAPEKVRDEAFQLYLRTLPDLSIRKNFIHRQGTPGYSQDAIRALAGHIFHGSFQIARMRYSHELDALRREAEQIARNMATMGDPAANGAGAVVNELKKRHEWVLNPTDNGLVNKISSVGFVYYLGLTPAAALVNLLQTPMVAFPVLAARHDAGKVARELWRAMRESLGTYGHMERKLEGDELLAHQEFARRGVFDKTQAHNLAGVSESDTHAYSPGWHKVMTVISHVFHKAEVVNREATAMAAYRLARADGAGHAEAIHQANRDVHESQFDYSNANRARWMQSSAAKVLLMFRQYSLAVTWLIGRAFYQAIKGADPETRTMARRKLTGILGMTALFSGTLGLPVLGSVGAILNALAAAFGDDDEPWDWETELRAFLREMLGDTGAEAILRGPVQALTGVAIAQRVGISDLWFREPDRELEGRAWANYLFEQAAGPMGGLVTNFFRGQQLMAEGHVWRGVETIMPKAIKDAMKSVRYVTDGVNNLRGDAIVEDLNVFESLAQIAGFSPASVAAAYDYQRDIKGYEQYILDRRRALMDAFALAYRLGDIEGRDAVLAKMREFSAAYPALAITADGIRRSLMSRARYSQQADAGIIVDRRLRAGLEDRLGASG